MEIAYIDFFSTIHEATTNRGGRDLMAIYTKTGDRGETDLLGGDRVTKDHARLEVCGNLDELNAWLGLVRCQWLPEDVATVLERVQHRLFAVGTELATVDSALNLSYQRIGPADVAELEQAIDRCDGKLPKLTQFILPAGSQAAAMVHVARAVCRRAERRIVSLAKAQPDTVSADVVVYINRLSDLLFVLARTVNAEAGFGDVPK